MYPIEIISLAKYLPEKIVTNDDLGEFVETSDEWISTRTGIKQRRISTGENTSDLCTEVCKKLLNDSGIDAEQIGLIVVASVSPDYIMPSTACIVQKNIGAHNAFAFDISAACTGFVYALSIAEKYVSGGMCEYAIVLGAETLSKLTDWGDRGTCVLFGDGAGGALIGRSKNKTSAFIAEVLHSDGRKYSCMTSGGMPVASVFAKNQREENPYIKMDGREVLDFVAKRVPENINELLVKANICIDDVKYIVPHQANSRIVEIVARKLKMDLGRFYVNIEKYGNTSSATIPIALAEMIENNLLHYGSGDKVILSGFGGGLTWGCVLIEV